jgi:uncharacterized protein YcbX
MIAVSGLFVYPVKSCAGLALDEAEVTATGFALDRRWMVVAEDGGFLSQRSHPQLARIRVRVESDRLQLEGPHLPTLQVPLENDGSPSRRVTVWRDECPAIDEGREAAAFFSQHLGRPVRLVRLAGDDARPVSGPAAQPGDRVSFADGYPFLLLSQASLDGLNRRLSLPVPMDRFRPNIVVTGCGPHDEDRWHHLRIGSVDFRVAKPCARCVVTTTDQRTGERGQEPLRTLAEYRSEDGQVLFGQNLIHAGRGMVRIGDRVLVLATHR